MSYDFEVNASAIVNEFLLYLPSEAVSEILNVSNRRRQSPHLPIILWPLTSSRSQNCGDKLSEQHISPLDEWT